MIKNILEAKGAKILFLGKILNFSKQEINNFLNKYDAKAIFEYENQDIDLVVLSSLISPIEEELSYTLYEQNIPDVKLEEFEAYYISTLKPNSLLMSLKLSNNQERLISFLKSKALSDELFLKLLKLYSWNSEGLFDSDSNRDVALSFIERFFKRENYYNHTDIAHSPTTILNIALNSTNSDVLETLLTMPNLAINTRGQEPWKPKDLREFIATNSYINSHTKKLLLNFNSNRIFRIIALNSALNANEQEFIYDKLDTQGKINLSINKNLDDKIFNRLLNEDIEVVQALLLSQKISKDKLSTIEPKYLPILCQNPNISHLKDQLLFKTKELDFAIASNSVLESSEIENLYKKYGLEIALELAQNPNTPSTILEEFYKLNNLEITKAIATNPNTSEYIIDELFNKNSNELNTQLAKNPNLKSEYIEYFKLDPKLLLLMSQAQDIKSKIVSEIV